jgi:hypothetical protein
VTSIRAERVNDYHATCPNLRTMRES